MKGREVIKIMESHGWVLDRVAGSHHVMIKEGRRSVPVPVHGKEDLGVRARKILKRAGIDSLGGARK